MAGLLLTKYKKHIIVCLCLGLLSIQVLESRWRSRSTSAENEIAQSDDFEILSLSSINQNVERLTLLGDAKTETKAKKESSVIMNDPNMSEKWGLKLTDSKAAWNLTKGSKDIIIAVIDTGIDINHEDLKKNLWVNKGETGKDSKGRNKRTNGIDDDNNGYVDDVHGWSFTSKNSDLTDNHGHGTHISGILGAVGGNGKGISGVSPNVSIMTLKYYDPRSPGLNNLENTVKSIHYAVENGAKIINYSGGGLEFSKEEEEAISKAQKKGILFVAAAGNEKSNSDTNKYYPADYELNNIISVTALDPNKNILPSSNYGVVTVDIAAPGKNIYSTLPRGRYGYMTGTSQATAFVSGVAALLMAHNPDFDANQVSKYIKNTGDVIDSLKGKTRYNRKLNSYRALSILDQNVGATGVVANNVSGMDEEAFSSENKFDYTKSSKLDKKPSANLGFSTALLDKIKKGKRGLDSKREPNSKKDSTPQTDEAEKKPSPQK
ncbi:MAG: S8 family peptidase [Bdellovibrionales bacterium]